MRFDGNGGSAPNCEPNSYTGAPKQAPEYAEPELKLTGAADRYDHRSDGDYFFKADPMYGASIAKGLGIDPSEIG